MLDKLGVVNEVPVPNDVPPVAVAYQFNVPALAVAPKVTVPLEQRLLLVTEPTLGIAFTVTLIAAVVSVAQTPDVTLRLYQVV